MTCAPSPFPGFKDVNVQVSGRFGNGIVQGYGSANNVVCDGTPHTVDVLVSAQCGW